MFLSSSAAPQSFVAAFNKREYEDGTWKVPFASAPHMLHVVALHFVIDKRPESSENLLG